MDVTNVYIDRLTIKLNDRHSHLENRFAEDSMRIINQLLYRQKSRIRQIEMIADKQIKLSETSTAI